MGDGAAENEAAFERIKDMFPSIFPLVDHSGRVRGTAEDALTLLPGTYLKDVIVNFYARNHGRSALHTEKLKGVLVLLSYVLNLILDKGPQRAISACSKLIFLLPHLDLFQVPQGSPGRGVAVGNAQHSPLLQAAHGLGPKTSVRVPAKTIFNSFQGLRHAAP